MIEAIGLVLAVLGIVFAFEAPRRGLLSVFCRQLTPPVQEAPNSPSRITLSDHDRQLIENFRALFAESGHLRMYQSHDFLLPLKREATVPLYTVVETWVDEAHFFSNQELRCRQIAFIKAANELAFEIIRYTVPDDNGNISVIMRDMDPHNIPSYVRNEANSINAKLPAFLKSHENLLALCNKTT